MLLLLFLFPWLGNAMWMNWRMSKAGQKSRRCEAILLFGRMIIRVRKKQFIRPTLLQLIGKVVQLLAVETICCSIISAPIHARIKTKVRDNPRHISLLSFYAVQHNYKSGFYVKGCKFSAKKCFVCLVGMGKNSTFAPAIERDAAVIEILKVKLGLQNHSKKTF